MTNDKSNNNHNTHAINIAKKPWLQRIAYETKYIEFIIYISFISGLILWDGFNISWTLIRPMLALHFIISLLILPILILPFWLSHRKFLTNPSKKSGKKSLHITGRIIEIILIILFASGFYLVFFGNRGGIDGEIAYYLHLLPALPLTILVFYHAKKWSMIKIFKWVFALSLVIFAMIIPAFAGNNINHNIKSNSSGALQLSPDGLTIYSANYDAGSISIIERKSGKRLDEVKIGDDIRRIAINFNENILAATDYSQNKIILIDIKSKKILSKISIGSKPFGIVFDEKNNLFWVTIFEDSMLLAIGINGDIIDSYKVNETPRGLAIMDDGRLLITHAMIGEISIYNSNILPLLPPKIIKLHETQNKKQTISQGLPRLLDDIAISPDGREAWLPHLLWNFDHPFQFQSTIFPSLSILSLEYGKERELTKRRKHLFKQINIIQSNRRTRIVSNPHDAEFSNDGKKLYVTLAASEDLMVFDLSRRKALNKKKKKTKLGNRRRGKKNQGGAKAVQIYRHIPGDNPRGLIVDNDDIYIQNAMSLNMVHMDTGGNGSFAKVKLLDDNFTKLVANDPLPKDLRMGKRLFNSGNSDDFKKTPIAGDNWMSCQSCHLDGFNFTNGYLYESSPFDKYQNAVIGHADLGNMIAGDFIGDYIRIIQKTQGGMGEDKRDGALDIKPESPDETVVKMMDDLHQYVTANENLPMQASWLRLDIDKKDIDGKTNIKKTVHESQWVNSAACAECHSDMFKQWSNSLHRLMGDSNPYYKVTEEIAAQSEGEEFRKWCMSCHHPQGILSGLTATTKKGHMFEKDGASLFEALANDEPDLDEGTGCLFCHRITKIEMAQGKNAGANASFTVNLKDRQKYIFENNDNDILNWVGNHQINAKPKQHAMSYQQPFYKKSEFCSTCHNEFAPGSGSLIVNTFGEWQSSPFNNPDDPTKHRDCIDCHMHGDIAKIGEDIPGISTDGGRVKNNVVTHQFTGANHHLVGLRSKELAEKSIALLRTSARISARIDKITTGDTKGINDSLIIKVENIGAGHALPTGVADFRQIWLDITLKDRDGKIILTSGKMDKDGVIDVNSRFFRKVFGDKNGKPVGLKFWRYEKMISDTKIPAGGFRDEAFTLPKATKYPLMLDVKLMFRIYPQGVTDIVRQSYPELPNPSAVIMNHLNIDRLSMKMEQN